MSITNMEDQIFKVSKENFDDLALSIFRYQAENIPIYKQYIETLKILPSSVNSILAIPYLPIQFFKSHSVISPSKKAEKVFESSGTTGQNTSKHYVESIALYEKSFTLCFERFFGSIKDYCVLALLPSYLERGNSSLVYMTQSLIKDSCHAKSDFYLNNTQELFDTIQLLEAKKQKTILIGVTYALLDFAQQFPMKLNYVQLIETGGMKGRRKELIRDEVHTQLKNAFGLSTIYSEYGMTELLSQAYSLHDGVFDCPPWMRILIRDVNDPFQIMSEGKGLLNVIDLANIHSCSFIATDDIVDLKADYSFQVVGRRESADLRGCSLLIV